MDLNSTRKQKWNKTEWANARRRAIASLDAMCAICHRPIDLEAAPFTPLAVEVDHITPRSRGGALKHLTSASKSAFELYTWGATRMASPRKETYTLYS